MRVGHYEILEELGRGGMGVVYRARDLNLGRRVALKCPWPRPPAGSTRQRQFLREARAVARLSHPSIVPIFEVLEDDQGLPWIAMELVEGTSLRAVLADGRPLPLAETLHHAEAIAAALQTAHARDILHRDVNPNNIMVTSDGRVLLADFGLARFLRVSEESSTRSRDSELDEPGRAAGTPRYMSPEQALGKPLDRRSDLFSLGAVLYEMCTGRPAFGGSGPEVMDAILHHEPTPISRFNYEVPEDLERIVRKALAKRPEERYQDARDLLVDLRALQRRREHDDGEQPLPRRPALRNWRTWGVAAAALAALVAWIIWSRPSRPPAAPRTRLAVLAPQPGPQAAASWPELIQALFVRELTGVEQLGVLDPLTLNGLLEGSFGTRQPARGPRLYEALRSMDVTLVLDGTVVTTQSGYRLQSNLVAVPSGEVQFSDDEQVLDGEDHLPQAVAGLANRVLAFLQINVLQVARNRDLRPWLSQRPRNLEALKAFVQATEYIFRYEPGARPYLERAVALDPSFVAARVWLISALVMSHHLDLAREQYRYLQAMEPHPSPFEQALIDWAGAYIADDPAAQARHLEVALRYSPDNDVLLVTLAEARFRMDDFAAALDALAPPIRNRWRYPQLYTLQGVCLIALGRHQEARNVLTRSLDITPVDPDVYGMLAALAWRAADPAEAERLRELYFERSRRVGAPNGAVNEGMCGHLLRVGLADQAPGFLRLAMSSEDTPPDYHDYLTVALYRSSQIGPLTMHLRDRVRADTRWPDGHLLLGRIAEERGAAAEATREYESFISLDPRSPATQGVEKRLAVLRRSLAQSPAGP